MLEGVEESDNPSVGAASERVDSDELGSWVVVKLGGVAAGFIGVVHGVGVVADATHIEVVAGVVIVGGKRCLFIALRLRNFSCRILCSRCICCRLPMAVFLHEAAAVGEAVVVALVVTEVVVGVAVTIASAFAGDGVQ